MDVVDKKYVDILSARLTKFKKVRSTLYNFRCPICGDSQKNTNKCRGYIYQKDSKLNYKCHNCGFSSSFSYFLKTLDGELYKKYIFDRYREENAEKEVQEKVVKPVPTFGKKIRLSKASENEIAKSYLEKRKLNPDKFYYAEKFKEWTNSIKPTFKTTRFDEPRIVIPFYDELGILFGFQGRTLKKNSDAKYITILFDESSPKIYGLDSYDSSKTVYILEGPFDSEFVDNSVAMCGADIEDYDFKTDDVVYIFDNEPRNVEICKRMEKIIAKKGSLVIWPPSFEYKDVNKFIESGGSINQIMNIIKENTYNSLMAKLKMVSWKKC